MTIWDALFDAHNRIDAPIAPGQWPAPWPQDVRIEGETLVCGWDEARRRGENRVLAPDSYLLGRFMGVAKPPETRFPARVLAFAQRYGPLGVDGDGRPSPLWALGGREHREALAHWRAAAPRVRAAARIIAAQRAKRTPPPDAWSALWPGASPPVAPFDEQQALVSYLHHLLVATDCRPILVAQRDGPPIWAMFYRSALAAVAWQLALLLTGGKDMLTCAECGNPFVPPHGVRGDGQRRFCPDCGRQAAVRQAARRYRRRQRAAPDA